MSQPVTKDMVDLLELYDVGTFSSEGAVSSGWPIFIGSEPDKPDNCITLYDAPGPSPNPKWLLDYPRFVVRVRSLSYPVGWAKAEEIKGVLLGLPSQDINAIRYVGIWVMVDTHFLKADDEGRQVFINTWRTIREPVEGEHRQPL